MSQTSNRIMAHRASGMTLVELMIVVAVVAILGTIANASYRRYLLRTNRTDAMTTLLQIQVSQEKFFLQNNSYATTLAQISAAPPGGLGIALGAGGVTTGGHYVISLPVGTATTYTAVATATAGQTGDIAACQTLNINEQGTKGPAAAVAAKCWR
jgi:type IV pilus assembly protein PilE